ncbi:hypothetical protein ACFL0F_00655 [Patescibacteria group bacterium]
MKKITLITTILFALLFTSTVQAKNTDDKKPINNKSPIATMAGKTKPEKPMDSTPSASASKKAENSIRKLERIQERINNPEVGEQIRETTRNQEQVQLNIETKMQEMNARPGYLKFILGPDYKNAGEVRSNIVKLQNQEKQLTRLKDKLPEDTIEEMEEVLTTVQEEINSYEQKLQESLEGFSLFGWLNKFLAESE